jgi:type-F conjugative transfer system pilin acetylase TraX
MPAWTPGITPSEMQIRSWLTPGPGAADVVKLLALLAMIVDHVNTVLMPVPRLELYALGRAALPLFTLIWAMHVTRTPQRLQHRANRLWIWAMVTQPVFTLTFHGHIPWYALNILFVFACATQLLAWHHRAGQRGILAGMALMCLLAWPLMPASYGIPGLVLALSLAVWFSDPPVPVRLSAGCLSLLALLLLNGATHLLDNPVPALAFAIVPTLLLPLTAVRLAAAVCPTGAPRFMPGPFFWLAYPGHLTLLLLIQSLP